MSRPRNSLAALAAFTALGGAPQAFAEAPAAVFPADAQERQFGASLGLSGRWAVVAAPGSRTNDAPYLRGAAYVFERGDEDTWQQQAKIMPVPGDAGTFKVAHVAIDARTVVISGTEHSRAGEAGIAYVYMRNGRSQWLPRAVLRSESSAMDGFGSALAIDRDTLIVGASGDNDRAGAAHVFARTGTGRWRQVARLTASDANASARFGSSVALHGNLALIGSHTADDNKGSAYVFVRNKAGKWKQEAKLTPDGDATRPLFGAALAVRDQHALIGAPGEEDFEGAAYLFTRASDGSWSRTGKLRADDGLAFDQFGISVALSRSAALVGANHGDHTAPRINGAAYVFEREGSDWTQKQKIESALDGEVNDLGGAVAIGEGTGLIGAQHQDDSAGVAFFVPCVAGCTPSR